LQYRQTKDKQVDGGIFVQPQLVNPSVSRLLDVLMGIVIIILNNKNSNHNNNNKNKNLHHHHLHNNNNNNDDDDVRPPPPLPTLLLFLSLCLFLSLPVYLVRFSSRYVLFYLYFSMKPLRCFWHF
jgi:hypothetical protein